MPDPAVFTSVINSYLPEPHASLLNGILFGVNLRTSKVFYEELRTVGLIHIVVLSGMNITLLGAVLMNITVFFGKYISSLLTILVIVFFILFVGVKAPILRAGVMGVLTLVAFMFGRKNFVFFALFVSAIVIFIFKPAWLATISFQLSYAATLGILLFGATIKVGSEKNILAELKNSLIENFRISLAAQVFTVPIIFIYFRQISLISPLSNVLVAPVIAPLMVFGFITSILGKIHFSL